MSSPGDRTDPGGSLQPRAERLTINHEFQSVDDFIREYVSNISATGAFIRSDQPLPIGTRVNLHFTIILDDLETIQGVGRVVRVSEEPRGMGVVFEQLTDVSQALIGRLLTRRGEEMP